MSAEAMGGRLLAEMQEESLDEVSLAEAKRNHFIPLHPISSTRYSSLTRIKLLSELRSLANSQPTDVLQLPQVDRLLELFRAPPPLQAAQWTSPGREVDDGSNTGTTTPARLHTTTRKAKPAAIQITSTHSASGKTNLLYLFATLAVLPKIHDCKGETVVWFDTDGRFSPARLNQVLLNTLTIKSPSLTSNEKATISLEALRHIHVFRPQSSSQLLSTFQQLPYYLLNLTSHSSNLRSLDLLVLDSATAFYWQDRFKAEIARYEALGNTNDTHDAHRNPALRTKTTEIITSLKSLQKLFDCTIIFTTSSHTKAGSTTATNITTSDGRQLPQEAPRISPWTSFATLSLTISSVKVPQFAAQMSLEECQRDLANRLAALLKGRFIVSVDWTNSETWPSGVGDAVSKLDGNGSLALRIINGGVMVEE